MSLALLHVMQTNKAWKKCFLDLKLPKQLEKDCVWEEN